jgi:hypothetical protein
MGAALCHGGNEQQLPGFIFAGGQAEISNSSKLVAAEIIVNDSVKTSGPTTDYSPPFQGGAGGGWISTPFH